MPSVAGPIYSGGTVVPIVLHFTAPYDAPACAPGCVLSIIPLSGNGTAYLDPTQAGYSASRPAIFVASADRMNYTTQVLVSAALARVYPCSLLASEATGVLPLCP